MARTITATRPFEFMADGLTREVKFVHFFDEEGCESVGAYLRLEHPYEAVATVHPWRVRTSEDGNSWYRIFEEETTDLLSAAQNVSRETLFALYGGFDKLMGMSAHEVSQMALDAFEWGLMYRREF